MGLLKHLVPLIEPKSNFLLPAVWLLSELFSNGKQFFQKFFFDRPNELTFLPVDNCIKAFIDSKGLQQIKNCTEACGELTTEISYDIFDQALKYGISPPFLPLFILYLFKI